MAKTKSVKFYYYKCSMFRGDDNTPFNLGPLFQEIQRGYSTNNERFVYEFNGEPAKLSYIALPYDDSSHYQLTFERLRNYNFPVKTKFVGDSSELSLSEDEFLGEEVTVLYDSENAVMMIQNNRDSLNYKAIELFFNSLLQEQLEGGVLFLTVISGINPLNKVSRLIGARDLLFKGDIQVVVPGNGPVGDLLSAIQNDITNDDANRIDIEVRIVAKNRLSSDRPYIPQTIMNEIISYNNKEGIKKLSVKGRNLEGIIEEINLVNDKFFDSYYFSFSEEHKYLDKNSVFSEMQSIYNRIGKDRIERNR